MTTWGVQLQTLESRAAEHDRFASQLVASLAEPLRHLATRTEGLRKHHAEYAEKLERERDGTYTDLRKSKGRYDSVCQEVENRRKKIDSSYDHGKSKAQTAYQQQQEDMRNTKVARSQQALRTSLTDSEHLPYRHQCHKQAEGKVLPRICTGPARCKSHILQVTLAILLTTCSHYRISRKLGSRNSTPSGRKRPP